jgi:hypothetical protein
MSKQARAMALLVLENAELRAWVDRAKEAAPVERAHIRKEYAVMTEALEADLEEAHKRIAELESQDQHYPGELRTFFEGVRALIGAEEMKDDCSSVLQELGRHTKRPGPASSARGWVLESQDEVRELLRKQREERYPPTPRPDPEVKAPSLRAAIKEIAWGAGIRFIENEGDVWVVRFSTDTDGFKAAFESHVAGWRGTYFSDYDGVFDCAVDWVGSSAMLVKTPE